MPDDAPTSATLPVPKPPARFRRVRLAVCVFFGVLTLALVVLWGHLLSDQHGTHRSIPLNSILSTSGQSELQVATANYKMADGEKQYASPNGHSLAYLFETAGRMGATNVFLVDAPSISEAIKVSGNVFAGYRPANYAVTQNGPNPPRGNYWLVVFLGIAGSGPTRWLVDDVTVSNDQIRFSYHRNPAGYTTCDIHHYLYWISIGKLDEGIYRLELFDTASNAVTLMRQVTVNVKSH